MMFLNQDQGVKDVGKDNFRGFFESMRSPNRYKSIKNSQSLDSMNFKTQNKTYQTKLEENFTHKPLVTESQKLDSFLITNTKVAQPKQIIPISQINYEKSMQDPEFYQHSQFLNSKNQSNSKSILSTYNNTNNSQTTLNKTSYYFNGPPRFFGDKNQNSYNLSEVNHLISDNIKPNQKNIESIQQVVQKSKENSQSYFETNANFLYTPKLRLEDLKKQINLQKEQSEIKQHRMKAQKSNRIISSEYRSGILQIESPENEHKFQTLYPNQREKLFQSQIKSQNIHNHRLQSIGKFITTNSDIEFDNDYNKFYDQKKQQYPQISYELDQAWNHRVGTKNPCQKRQTWDNCFGHNLDDQRASIQNKRALYLRSKELNGKEYNLVTREKLKEQLI